MAISLPAPLLQRLSLYSHKYNVPESKILEDALKAYFSKLKRQNSLNHLKRHRKTKKSFFWLKKDWQII
jgi:hypothetical protein